MCPTLVQLTTYFYKRKYIFSLIVTYLVTKDTQDMQVVGSLLRY